MSLNASLLRPGTVAASTPLTSVIEMNRPSATRSPRGKMTVTAEVQPDSVPSDDGAQASLGSYWHPIAMTSEIGEQPRRFMLLGEPIVAFRDENGPFKSRKALQKVPRIGFTAVSSTGVTLPRAHASNITLSSTL